jgi:UDP-N-acetyl-D-mannosaminuronic acid dehydrogenase
VAGRMFDAAIVGGCGHVGLPLGAALADTGLSVLLYDIDGAAVERVNAGGVPHAEPGLAEVLGRVRAEGRLEAATDPAAIARSSIVIVVVGTPIDAHGNPDVEAVPRAVAAIAEHLRDGQLLVLRSTVYPGVTASVERLVERLGKAIDVAFCPERIAEGKAMLELYELPQIVASRTATGRERGAKLFGNLTRGIVFLDPEEAELAKLFTNTWRYIRFAIANQFYMIANDFGLDFERIRSALRHDYPRAADLPGAGFAAGPCLLKDTMQLAAFNNNLFTLGHAAVMVNEGLPLYLVSRLARRYDLSTLTVGLLGMAFKADSDDIRSSLAYKMNRILRFKSREVLCTDPYVTSDPNLVPLDAVLARADLLVITAPHAVYADLRPKVPVVDVWNLLGQGVRV